MSRLVEALEPWQPGPVRSTSGGRRRPRKRGTCCAMSPGMSRSISFTVIVFVALLFVGSALKAQAATTPAQPAASAAQPADASANLGYWAAWSEAAAH